MTPLTFRCRGAAVLAAMTFACAVDDGGDSPGQADIEAGFGAETGAGTGARTEAGTGSETADADDAAQASSGELTEPDVEGAVYAMSNDPAGNTIVAWTRDRSGRLQSLGEYTTEGMGGRFGDGGLNPLRSSYALLRSRTSDALLAVNAGSDTISVLAVADDWTLRRVGNWPTGGRGPNAIAENGEWVYVASIDADGEYTGVSDQQGSLMGYRWTEDGTLLPIEGSLRELTHRPSAIRFSPDGQTLVVASFNAGSAALPGDGSEELVRFAVERDGTLSPTPIGLASSTRRGDRDDRNLPSAIGLEIIEDEDVALVVVAEARMFGADGSPPSPQAQQAGSVSTFRLEPDGALTHRQTIDSGQQSPTHLGFSPSGRMFWVANSLDATLSTFVNEGGGMIRLLKPVAGLGALDDGWIDLAITDDGRFLYQLYGAMGTVGVFVLDENGAAHMRQEIPDMLPMTGTQGIAVY